MWTLGDYELLDWIMYFSHVYTSQGLWCPERENIYKNMLLRYSPLKTQERCQGCGMLVKEEGGI